MDVLISSNFDPWTYLRDLWRNISKRKKIWNIDFFWSLLWAFLGFLVLYIRDHLFFSQCHLNNQWVKANPDVSESNISGKICNWFNDLKLDLKRQMWNDQKVLRPMVYIESFCTENQLQAPTFLNRHTTNVIAICCGTKFLKYVYLNIKFLSIVWARV